MISNVCQKFVNMWLHAGSSNAACHYWTSEATRPAGKHLLHSSTLSAACIGFLTSRAYRAHVQGGVRPQLGTGRRHIAREPSGSGQMMYIGEKVICTYTVQDVNLQNTHSLLLCKGTLLNNLCIQSCIFYKTACTTASSTICHEAFVAADSTGGGLHACATSELQTQPSLRGTTGPPEPGFVD